jgi:endonuclease-3
MAFMLLSQKKAGEAVSLLEREYNEARYYLDFSTPIDLAVAAILSAQTHDYTVNAITPGLFKKYRTAKDYANADPERLAAEARGVAFAGSKARNIVAACKIINEKFGGRVPDKMADLVELPGIGRKTANTILINAYGIVEGIPVDTWVIKLSGRIGLSGSGDPDGIERDLMKKVSRRYWKNFAYVLKEHGHRICHSQVPLCSKCLLNRICPRNGVVKSA